jgi:SAM-dependent methyltransferase
MTPATYEDWYFTPRGRSIGDQEFDLLLRLLNAKPGETILDVGCGTGYFSRRFARERGLRVTGIDINPGMLAFARDKSPDIEFAQGDMEDLPFTDASFDYAVAITSLCFVPDEARAVCEMARVARQRVVLGLLNRNSLLWICKRGAGSYVGAHWHTRGEARALLVNAGLGAIHVGNAIHCPEGGEAARWIGSLIPDVLPGGSFLGVAGAVRASAGGNT